MALEKMTISSAIQSILDGNAADSEGKKRTKETADMLADVVIAAIKSADIVVTIPMGAVAMRTDPMMGALPNSAPIELPKAKIS